MRKVSKKRLAKLRQVGRERRSFVERASMCMACREAPATDCHEIACGSHRDAALGERLAWLAVCRVCNCERLTDRDVWPLTRQLAVKWLHDRPHFDLLGFNALRGRAPGAITWPEVCVAVCRELDRTVQIWPAHLAWPKRTKDRVYQACKDGFAVETIAKAVDLPIGDIVDYLRSRNVEMHFRNRAWGASRFICVPREETAGYVPSPEEIAQAIRASRGRVLWRATQRAQRPQFQDYGERQFASDLVHRVQAASQARDLRDVARRGRKG